jgi:carbamoyl-phosphate synthase large subunit
MASTGEVACFGNDLEEAFLKSFIAVGNEIPKKNILLSVGRMEDKLDLLGTARLMVKLGYNLYATEGTTQFLSENGVKAIKLHRVSANKSPNIAEYLGKGKLDMAIVIPTHYAHDEMTDGYRIRRKAVDMHIPLITNVQVTKVLMRALEKYKIEDLKIDDWNEYKS